MKSLRLHANSIRRVTSNHVNQIGSLFAGYDSAGDMTSDGTSTYQYDAEGRLATVVQSGSTYQTNTYNSLGQLVESDFPGFNAKVLGAFDASGRELGYYNGVGGYWWDQDVRAGGRMLAQEFTGVTYFLHANTIGSDTQVTNQAGTVLMDMLYYPWGEVWQTAGSTVDSHFAGFQQSAGPIFQTPNRSYLGSLGRWMSPDPLGGDVTNPQSLNRYGYVTNNPTTLTDPLGLYPSDSSNPASLCNDPKYYWSHADCDGPPPDQCDTAIWAGPCDLQGPPWGGPGDSSTGRSTTSAPPAGQPPLAGNSLLHQYPCLSPGQLEQLEGELLGVAGAQLGTQLSAGAPPTNPVFGGAQNIYTTASPANPIYVNPQVISQAVPADLLEQFHGWTNQLIVPDTHLTGPGNVVHILFKTNKNAAGQVAITALKIHADIAGQEDVVSAGRHFGSDVFLAWWSSLRQHGCAVKLF